MKIFRQLAAFSLLLTMIPPVLAQIPVSERKERVHTYLLNIYINQKRKPEAMSEYKTLLAMKPNDPKLNAELAKFEASSGNYAQAITLMKKACELDPDNSLYWGALGAIYLKAKDYQKAVDAYSRGGSQFIDIRDKTSNYLQHQKQRDSVKKPVNVPIKKQETNDDDW